MKGQGIAHFADGVIRMKKWALVLIVFLAFSSGSSAGEFPRIEDVCTVAADIIAVRIIDGKVEYGTQVPYEAHPDDHVGDPDLHRWVLRNGRCIGSLVGRDGRLLQTFDRLVVARIAAEWLDEPASYTVQETVTAGAGETLSPAAVYRKTKPSDFGRTGPWDFAGPMEHVVYLKLPRPLEKGQSYRLEFQGQRLGALDFKHDPRSQRSEAVHVSHIGFRPDDPAKMAFLSCWMGSGRGVDYPNRLQFCVLDDATGEATFEGKIRLSKAADDRTEDAHKRNYNGTDVYEMDFSPLDKPGRYRVYVEGVGCSYPFEISKDVWRDAFHVSARGFYHQRSGIEMGPPYTDFRRPRSFHPDDGVVVYASTASLMDTGNGLNKSDNNFGNLVKGKTEEVVPDAWGGYMDAGDWDRRIQHLDATRVLLELAELFPDYFAGLGLNIPESENALPDIIDEALWNLDFYRRMQTDDGGIRGGIESAEHPRYGEASWQESLDVLAYAPGIWSSYIYAGVAARAARWLGTRDADLAGVYRDSALRAMKWAEDKRTEEPGRRYPQEVNDARNLAAAELFRLTGAGGWHDVFLETTKLTGSRPSLFVWQSHEQGDAAWVYVATDRPGMDSGLKENCRRAILSEAADRINACGRTGFRWTKFPYYPAGFSAFTSPDAVSLVRAHALTGERKYLRAAVLACQTGAGANPVNICYTTGLGHKSPEHALDVDSRITRQAPPPGLTVFGPFDTHSDEQAWAAKLVDGFAFPPVRQWPTIEAYWDVFWYPLVCEYTIHQHMARNAYVWGYLAARE